MLLSFSGNESGLAQIHSPSDIDTGGKTAFDITVYYASQKILLTIEASDSLECTINKVRHSLISLSNIS